MKIQMKKDISYDTESENTQDQGAHEDTLTLKEMNNDKDETINEDRITSEVEEANIIENTGRNKICNLRE